MKKKLCVISLIIIILINVLAMTVHAALSFTTTMTANNTKINPGSEVVISVKLSSLQVGENGINIFTAVLGYDTNVFEILTDAGIEGSNGWQSSYNANNGKVTLTKTSYVNSDEEIMQISLKVKSGVANGTKGSVSLSNVAASTPDDEIGASNVSTTITVGGTGSTTEPDEPSSNIVSNQVSNIIIIGNQTTNQVANQTTNQVANQSYSNSTTNGVIPGITNQIDNQTGEDIPYTGSESTAIVQIIVGIIIIALLLYRKIYSLEDV